MILMSMEVILIVCIEYQFYNYYYCMIYISNCEVFTAVIHNVKAALYLTFPDIIMHNMFSFVSFIVKHDFGGKSDPIIISLRLTI